MLTFDLSQIHYKFTTLRMMRNIRTFYETDGQTTSSIYLFIYYAQVQHNVKHTIHIQRILKTTKIHGYKKDSKQTP